MASFLFPTYEDAFHSTEKAITLFDFCGIELSADEVTGVDDFINRSQKFINKKIDPADPLEIHIRNSIARLLDHDAHKMFCDITGNQRDYFNY